MSLFDIQRVTVGPKTMVARVRLANGAPVKTSEDLEGTSRVYHLMPQIADHACVCEKGDQLRDSMGDTELAHLLEHVALEFLARLGVQDISVGRTIDTNVDRTWDIELTCPDDAMTLGALSSAAWLGVLRRGRSRARRREHRGGPARPREEPARRRLEPRPGGGRCACLDGRCACRGDGRPGRRRPRAGVAPGVRGQVIRRRPSPVGDWWV